MTDRRNHHVLTLVWLAALLVTGCSTQGPVKYTMADMDIVAQDSHLALVRLRSGQSFEDIAQVFYGDAADSWQIREVNVDQSGRAGQVVAVPFKPNNVTSVYADGYRTIPILCYHQFTGKSEGTHELEISAAKFEKQIRYLIDSRFKFLSFADLETILEGARPIPEKAVIITIDDGYRSIYDIAWPILHSLRVPTTLFIYTDFVGAPAALDWDQIKEMVDSGIVEIQSHTKSHSSLARQLSDTSEAQYRRRLANEVRSSSIVIEQKLGEPVRYLSYPYGDSSESAAEVSKSEGIRLAATVTRGDNSVFSDPYFLHRTMIYNSHSMIDFQKLLRTFRHAH